jgi:hypothetical protein
MFRYQPKAGSLLLYKSQNRFPAENAGKLSACGEPAISHDSHHVSLVQWTNLFASRHKGHRFKSPGGTYVKPGILLLTLSRYKPRM